MNNTTPRYLFLALAATSAVGAALYGLDYVFYPWAYAQTDRPPLVDYWRGDIAFAPDDRRAVALHLTHPMLRPKSGSRFNLFGTAKVCGPRGAARYNIVGAAENRHATRLAIGFGAASLGAGTHLNETSATWDGANRIELRTRLFTVGADGAGRGIASIDARSGAMPRIGFELRRSTKDEFDTVCGGGV